MPLPLKAGIWIRVSTEEQARGESPKHHEARARAYAELKGWEVVEIYNLSGVSGKEILSHPETQRMLDDVRKERIQALIFSKLARLARNVKELLEIAEIFQKYNANLVSLDENIDTSSPAGRLLFVVIGALAQWEREEIAERVRASVPVRARMGKNTGGIGPFGYKWENGKLVINPDEAYVVKRAYQLYLETGKLLTTCRRLTEEGLKARKSNFTTVTLKRMLTDTVYKGLKRANYTKTRGKGKSWELKPEEDWVYFKVEPIVDEGLWEKVNEMIRKNEENYKEMRVPKEGRYLFSGLVVCGLCGKKMYVYPYERMKDPIYRCRCRNKIRESILENKFKEGLEHLVVHPESFKKIEDEERFKIEELKERKEGMERELRKVKHKIDKLFSLWEDELIDKKSFRERFEELNRQKEEIEETISRIQAEIDFYSVRNISLDFIINQARRMKDMWDLLEEDEKREMAKLLLEKIQVGDGKITFFYNCPSEFMKLENDNHIYRDVYMILKNSNSTGISFLEKSFFILPQEAVKGYPEKLIHIGHHIRKRRIELGMSQRELAKLFEVTEETIYNWENGKKTPALKFIPKIIAFLGYVPFRCESEDLIERLKFYKFINGLTVEELAERLSKHPDQVRAWLTGRRKPSRKNEETIRKFLEK
jgi:site-specific DNA recombinase